MPKASGTGTNVDRVKDSTLIERQGEIGLAVLSLAGGLASAVAVVASFWNVRFSAVSTTAIILLGDLFVVYGLAYISEYPRSRSRTYMWNGFREQGAAWVHACNRALLIGGILNCAVYLLRTHGAAASVHDGTFVLENHGRVLKQLTEAEYESLTCLFFRAAILMTMPAFVCSGVYWTTRAARAVRL